MKNRLPIITLLTDFGVEDTYVGVMKGVIATIAPQTRVIDLTHAIPEFDIIQAAFRLKQSFPFFPEATIHVAVVDPGVGSNRRAVAMKCGGHIFIAPDNGLLAPIASEHAPAQCVALTNEAFFRTPVSATFHGRDIFAPVAAHIANGTALSELGQPLESLTPLNCPRPTLAEDGTICGEVLWTDRFGNLATNIPENMLKDKQVVGVRVGGKTISGLSKTFSDVAEGKPLAMIGSFAMLEIAIHQGNAAKELAAASGTVIEAVFDKGST